MEGTHIMTVPDASLTQWHDIEDFDYLEMAGQTVIGFHPDRIQPEAIYCAFSDGQWRWFERWKLGYIDWRPSHWQLFPEAPVTLQAEAVL